jgi:uncharacterized protein
MPRQTSPTALDKTMPETPTTALAVYSPRPTLRVNGQDVETVSALLLAMAMTEQEGGLSSVELRFSNVASDPQGGAGWAFEDGQSLTFGAEIAVYAGDETAPQEIFRGIITALEAEFPEESPPELVVLAEDAAQKGRMVRRSQTYPDTSLKSIAEAIASRLGLTPVITGLTATIGTQVQLNESDLAFLRRLLHRYDADGQVVGDELQVSPRSDVRRGQLELGLHSQLRRARVIADLAHQTTEVTVGGWNPDQGRAILGTSRGDAPGPGHGQTGAQILRQAIAERPHHISHLAVSTEDEAQAAAAAAFDQRARRFVVVEGCAEGNPALRVGTHVALTGLGPRFDNSYYVVRTCHLYDLQQGYQTEFEAESAFWGGR